MPYYKTRQCHQFEVLLCLFIMWPTLLVSWKELTPVRRAESGTNTSCMSMSAFCTHLRTHSGPCQALAGAGFSGTGKVPVKLCGRLHSRIHRIRALLPGLRRHQLR